jgi:hypothetical protein
MTEMIHGKMIENPEDANRLFKARGGIAYFVDGQPVTG